MQHKTKPVARRQRGAQSANAANDAKASDEASSDIDQTLLFYLSITIALGTAVALVMLAGGHNPHAVDYWCRGIFGVVTVTEIVEWKRFASQSRLVYENTQSDALKRFAKSPAAIFGIFWIGMAGAMLPFADLLLR